MVTGRAERGLANYFGSNTLAVIMANTRVAELIMIWAHELDHAGRDTTLFTATRIAWIVGGRKLAAKVKNSCVRPEPESLHRLSNRCTRRMRSRPRCLMSAR